MDLKKLADKFPASKIEFRIGATNKDKTKGIVLAYVTNRAIQERLDDVCGADNWCNVFTEWKGDHQLCGISIKIDGEWVTKWDGAEDTNTEPVKGGWSASMKRAAAQWGIGRYLYDIPNEWAEIIPVGGSYKFKTQPKLPKAFLPDGDNGSGSLADVATTAEKALLDKTDERKKVIDKEQANTLIEIIFKNSIDIDKVKKFAKVKDLADMTVEKYSEIINIYTEQGFEIPKKKVTLSDNDKKGLEKLNKAVKIE